MSVEYLKRLWSDGDMSGEEPIAVKYKNLATRRLKNILMIFYKHSSHLVKVMTILLIGRK